MEYFPLFIRLEDRPCLIVGGGEIALRKAKLLLKSGARLSLLAPEVNPELAELASQGTLTIRHERFTAATNINAFSLLVAATDDKHINASVAEAAATAGILCNVVDNKELSTAIMPAIIDRTPIVIAVSSGGASPVLATRIRRQLERQFPPGLAALARFSADWRDRVKQAFSSVDARRHFWQRVFDGPVSDDVLAGKPDEATLSMQKLLANQDTTDGYAWITGAGPGDPELLTLKAARALASADTILHDRLVTPAILEMARRDAEFISVGKQAGRPSISQAEINALLVEKVAAGRRVCRLKGGDPFVFGRGGEEVEALEAAGLPWEVIPGITAASGCAAAVGLPLTHRQVARSVTYITASTADDANRDWTGLAAEDQTLVIYMAVKNMQQVCTALVKAGRPDDEAALVIENGTTDRQRMIRGTLATMAEASTAAGVSSPALLIVGKVASINHLVANRQTEPQPGDAWARPAQVNG